MKTNSIQFRFLITIISAMLTITIFIGGLSIYMVDRFVQQKTENFIKVTCGKEAAQMNDIFGDMEKSVNIMSEYILGFLDSPEDIRAPEKQAEIFRSANRMFADVANYTADAVAYYLRFSPELTNSKAGFSTARFPEAMSIGRWSLQIYPVMKRMMSSMWDGSGSPMKPENPCGCSHTITKTMAL